ncbi:hypothetical protein Tco_1489581, partial [Tanacetum coccineum]
DVVDGDQDVIHGNSSSNVASSSNAASSLNVASSSNIAMSANFCDFAHDIGDDDEVDPASVHVVSSDDSSGDSPQRPTKQIPSQCEGSGKRGVSKHQNLKKAFKNNGGPIELEKLPHNYESWEKLPEVDKASIIPSLEGYFNLRPHLNDETTIMVNGKKKTIGSMVHAGLKKDFQDRYSDNKFKFKRQHFTNQKTVKDARDNKPPGWKLGDDEWQKLINYSLEPNRWKNWQRMPKIGPRTRPSPTKDQTLRGLGRPLEVHTYR